MDRGKNGRLISPTRVDRQISKRHNSIGEAEKMHIAMSQAFDSATLQQYSARSARRHKAWGVSPRIAIRIMRKPAKRATAESPSRVIRSCESRPFKLINNYLFLGLTPQALLTCATRTLVDLANRH